MPSRLKYVTLWSFVWMLYSDTSATSCFRTLLEVYERNGFHYGWAHSYIGGCDTTFMLIHHARESFPHDIVSQMVTCWVGHFKKFRKCFKKSHSF